MPKKNNEMSIVTAWNWFVNVTELNNLSSSEQLVLIHMIKFLNKNFWRPLKIEPVVIAKSSGKDNRTVKKNLSLLVKKGFLKCDKEGRYYLGIDNSDSTDNGRTDTDRGSHKVFDFES